MEYTIKQVAEKVELTEYTLRYYEKEGLLPSIDRNEHGVRLFKDNDIEWIRLICCLRDTGMSILKIKDYVNLCIEGDNTIELRRQIILNQKIVTEQKIEEMNKHLDMINRKLKYYNDFIAGKHIDSCNPSNTIKENSNKKAHI
ncbi:MerR family transcriptional regulator [Clostridium sp. Mt-5]|uniref:MerR family transcriptional regulator n=1 Tax=Clostridium moutaii TaxID=3240932 RepID=A0ABV4BRD2_9CLOT